MFADDARSARRAPRGAFTHVVVSEIIAARKHLSLLFFRGHLEVCRDLIEAGANPNAEDGQDRTPMWIAVDSNRAGVVQLLCEAGAHTSQAGPEGRTPLHIAARQGFIECAELLLQHGAVVEGNPDK